MTVTDDGGVTTLWESKGMVHEPRLIAPRPRQAVIPSRVDLSQTTGTLILTNVYEGRNMDGVEPASIKKLLVMEDLPKPVNFHGGGTTPLAHGGSWTFKRILGTVPVEADGSANFEIPACRSINSLRVRELLFSRREGDRRFRLISRFLLAGLRVRGHLASVSFTGVLF